jgi:hypothetical protein
VVAGVKELAAISEQDEAWSPSTEVEKAAVLKQLEQLLGNPHFQRSKRFPVFLKFVVCETLANRSASLKERTLGVEVFGRDPHYDTNEDPIVRVTAAEIRKRIAQYYQDPGHENEIRLQLRPGSYIPQFYLPENPLLASPGQAETKKSAFTIPAYLMQTRKRRRVSGLVAVILLVCLAAGVVLWRSSRPSALDEFWAPFLKSQDPVLFCMADQNQYSTIMLRDAKDPQRQTAVNDHSVTVVIDDLSPLVNIAGMLQAAGRIYRVQGESSTTLTDLRRSPSVLIGAFDNSWTLRLTSPLRFRFANNSQMTHFWIEDRENPQMQGWGIDRSQQDTGTYKDYAIVGRLLDPNTGRFVVVVAGIGKGGTVAAGEFLFDPRLLNELKQQASKGWNRKNMEIVLETQIIDGRSGPPRIDAVYAW